MKDPIEESILERLPDGRIRYRDRRGSEQVGEQVGPYAIRGNDLKNGWFCSSCGKPLPPQECIVDFLDPAEDPGWDCYGTACNTERARRLADEAAIAGAGHDLLEWHCEMRHLPFDADWTPYRHWLRKRAS